MCITLFSLTGQVCKKSGWSTLVINIHCINNTYKKRGTTDMTSKPLDVSSLKNAYPLLNKITGLKPVFWENPHLKTMSHLPDFMISKNDMYQAESLWKRFAPFFQEAFPETKETKGIIESPLKCIDKAKSRLNDMSSPPVEGDYYLKCDNELPIAGSIKARGGVYEVLHYAEELALNKGLINKDDDYALFASEKFRDFFRRYEIGVGSTGNLGLSIGIISAKLGFNVTVYMSADAKQWKKDLLRQKGVQVQEFSGDFSVAIETGRQKTNENPNGYFVDDEDSMHLFLGYSVAALRLEKQLKENNITVDEKHPLFVYLPCGVGGAPGGITYGLKQVFGDHVHCFFVEPTHSPSVLIGLLTGLKDKVSVQDFGIDNMTDADGLAVGRPSKFATDISDHLISGIYTLEDSELYKMLAILYEEEQIFIEPSAASAMNGPWEVAQSQYIKHHHIHPERVTHIAWATGGELVPEKDRKEFYDKGISLLK